MYKITIISLDNIFILISNVIFVKKKEYIYKNYLKKNQFDRQ